MILIIAAHLDDIEIGLGGFLSTKENNKNIITYTACNGYEKEDKDREKIFVENMNELGIRINFIDKYRDTKLSSEDEEKIRKKLETTIKNFNIKKIYCINDDNHKDHKFMFDIAKITSRPNRSKVKELNTYQVYTDFNLNEFNNYKSFSSNKKYELLKKYNEKIDIKNIKRQDKVFGSKINKKRAEIIKNIFRIN